MRTLLILLLSAVATLAQSVFPPAFWAPATAAGVSCATAFAGPPSGTFDANGLGFGTSSNISSFWWAFTNTSTATVCKMDLAMLKDTGLSNGPIWLSIWSYNPSGQGNSATNLISKTGGDSDSINSSVITTSSTTNTWSWSANYPVLGASNYVVMVSFGGPYNVSVALYLPLYNPVVLAVTQVGTTNGQWNGGTLNNRRPIYKLYKQ